jgi:uncharacterized membrane protein
MVIVHFIFDLTQLYGIVRWKPPAAFLFLQQWGGVLFLLLSGICATLGSRSIRRGIIVFFCGMLCTAVTAGMYLLDMAESYIIIRFGVLHCLGICMILWALFKKLPTWALGVIGAVLIALGLWLQNVYVGTDLLFPLGLVSTKFSSSDYFPLLPNLGYFLLGSVLGRTLYRSKQSLLPAVNAQNPILRFLVFCGRQSLLIYLLHQPILSGLCTLLALF